MTTMDMDRQQAAELLPWYANGSLAEDQRAQVEAWVARDTALRADLEFLRQAGAVLRATAERPARSSVGRFLDRIAAEQGNAEVANVVGLKRAHPPAGTGRKWAFALAAGVMLAQAIVIGVLVSREGDDGALKPLSGAPQGQSANLQVTFVETTPEIEIRALLAEAGAQIVGGPGSLGVYQLHVAPEKLDHAEQLLRKASHLVASVSRPD